MAMLTVVNLCDLKNLHCFKGDFVFLFGLNTASNVIFLDLLFKLHIIESDEIKVREGIKNHAPIFTKPQGHKNYHVFQRDVARQEFLFGYL